jgi:energy-coupling factor transporter transmembrane protein EcfT
MNEENKPKTCGHHKVMPWALVLIGIAALLADFNILTWAAYNIIWPILLIIVGCAKMCKCGKKYEAPK